MWEKYKMDEKNNEKIKEIRISFDLIVVLYILIFLAIISIRISLGINPSINEMLYLIFTIIIFMFIMSFVRDLTIYRMWEDIIEAIEEYKSNKSKDG
jgi:L-asparagine transporter-like permease